MYYFTAEYINMDTDEVIQRAIKFDGQFLQNEAECFIYAMRKAYEMKADNELLSKVEFIAC